MQPDRSGGIPWSATFDSFDMMLHNPPVVIKRSRSKTRRGFQPIASPGLAADGPALRTICDARLVRYSRLDDPGLAMGWNRGEFAARTLDDYRRIVEHHVEAINVALQGFRQSGPVACVLGQW